MAKKKSAYAAAGVDIDVMMDSLKRIKRISTSNKSGPFVGSEFAFEDMTGQELNKYAYKMLEPEACGTQTCDRVDRLPLYEGSAYSHQIAWIDQTDHQIRRVEFFDRKGDLLKTLDYSDYRLYQGKNLAGAPHVHAQPPDR